MSLDPVAKEEKKDDKEPKTPVVTIDTAGIAARLAPVPVPPGNYRSLAVNDKALFWLDNPLDDEEKGTVAGVAIGHDEPEVKKIAEKAKSFELSADGKKLLIVHEKELLLADAALEKPDAKKSKVDLKDWTFAVEPREEWGQMFREAWRLERDYFYDRGMHGLDWPGIRRKYEPCAASPIAMS